MSDFGDVEEESSEDEDAECIQTGSTGGEYKILGAAKRLEQQVARNDAPIVSGQSLDSNIEVALETEEELATKQEQTRTWQEHSKAITSSYQTAGIKNHIIATKLATQKKTFMVQAVHESFVLVANQELVKALDLNQQIRIGYTEFFSVQGGLWQLSSTKLWLVFKNGKSWEQPGWTPGGHIRIQSIWGKSFIYLDFGHRSFSTGAIDLPSLASPIPVPYVACCDKSALQFDFTITFLGSGHMKVAFPAIPLVAADAGCKVLPLMELMIEFAARFEGMTN